MKTKLFIKIALLLAMLFSFHRNVIAQTNTFPATGNVGIGNLTPGSLLEVKGGNIDVNTTTQSYMINGKSILWHKGNTANICVGILAGFTQSNNPGYNTFVGDSCGYLTDGGSVPAGATANYNTFIGAGSARTNFGSSNNAHGWEAMFWNSSGYALAAFGTRAMYVNSSGSRNIAIGDNASFLNSTGNFNTSVGYQALYSNTASNNNALGHKALYSNTTGYANIAFGNGAYYSGSTGIRNIAIGDSAMFNVTTGHFNTAGGYKALYSMQGNSGSTAFGHKALYNAKEAPNEAFGYNTLLTCSTGVKNVAVGYEASTAGDMNATTAIGYRALYGNLVNYNTALGCSTLYANTTGNPNLAIGFESMSTNQTGSYCTAAGYQSLKANTVSNNTAFGHQVLTANTTGTPNDALGFKALTACTTGYNNVAVGYNAQLSNSSGYQNVAVGTNALNALTTGFNNTAVGFNSLNLMQGATSNCAFGGSALYNNVSGSYNSAFGLASLYNNTAGSMTAFGYAALYTNGTGTGSTAVGYKALYNCTGNGNTSLGYQALYTVNSGTANVGVGYNAGGTIGTGNGNTCVGYGADVNASGNTSRGAFGYNAINNQGNSTIWLGNTTDAVWTQLSYNTSDARFKFNVKEEVKGLEFIKKLRPVTYQMNTEQLDDFKTQDLPDSVKSVHKNGMDYTASKQIVHSGFLAQEVEQAAKQTGFASSIVSVPVDPNKSNYGLNYAEIVVPLVKAVQEQQKMIDSLQTQINALSGTGGRKINNSSNDKGVSIINTELSTTDAIVLNDAVPNPFAEQTIITYNIPKNTGNAQLLFYDQNGRMIKTVDITAKGQGQLNVYANDLTSGVYSYTLLVDGKVFDTKKMVKQ